MLQGNLQLTLGNFQLNSGEFKLETQGITVLFGRSGSGKSMLLRAIAGLEKSTFGQLSFMNETWQDGKQSKATAQRNLGFVFQDAALFPNKTVRQNLMYGVKRLPKGTPEADFDFIVQTTGIADKLDRSITNLSGGERQRVAIARALLMQPKLLFMDEPLSALDWRAKDELLTLIESLVSKFNLPIFYITHAPAEVERLADRVIFMQEGKIERIETLAQALGRLDSPLFADEGVVSVLHGEVGDKVSGLTAIKLGQDQLPLAEQPSSQNIRIRVLAKDVSLALNQPLDLSIINQLPATITEIINQDDAKVLIRLELADKQLLFAELTKFSATKLQLAPKMQVYALIKGLSLAE